MFFNRVVGLLVAIVLFAAVGQCLVADAVPAVWENLHYTRTVDLGRSYVKETDLIEVKNIDTKPHDEYFFFINDGFGAVPDVSALAVTLVDKPVDVSLELVSENVYKFKFPFPVAPQLSLEIKVRYVYGNALTPLPAQIDMDAVQTLLIRLNKFAYSAYLTKEYSMNFANVSKGQEMSLNLREFEGKTEHLPDLKPHVEDQVLKYGPLLVDVQPFTVHPMGLLYEHQRPITKATTLERSVWIPASGVDKISIEEYYELTNAGAALSKGFSRADYMKGRYEMRNHFSLQHLDFPMTGSSFEDYYYTDKVGVVSTHRVVQDHLLLQPRFPLFGGWKYNFTLGWNEKLSEHVHKVNGEPDTYVAKAPLVNTVRDIYYDDVSFTFYLPENAEFVNVSSPVAYESVSVGSELSYLDVSSGHVKVTVNYKNLVDDLSKVDVYIVYKYTATNYWYKVGKIAVFVFVALMSYHFVGLIDLSIEERK